MITDHVVIHTKMYVPVTLERHFPEIDLSLVICTTVKVFWRRISRRVL